MPAAIRQDLTDLLWRRAVILHRLQVSGLRAARVREIVAEIRTGFADPAFSPALLAAKLRMSERYIQYLLAATGLHAGCALGALHSYDDAA